MTKEDAEKKIREILDKDPRYKDAVVKIKFRDKSTHKGHTKKRY